MLVQPRVSSLSRISVSRHEGLLTAVFVAGSLPGKQTDPREAGMLGRCTHFNMGPRSC